MGTPGVSRLSARLKAPAKSAVPAGGGMAASASVKARESSLADSSTRGWAEATTTLACPPAGSCFRSASARARAGADPVRLPLVGRHRPGVVDDEDGVPRQRCSSEPDGSGYGQRQQQHRQELQEKQHRRPEPLPRRSGRNGFRQWLPQICRPDDNLRPPRPQDVQQHDRDRQSQQRQPNGIDEAHRRDSGRGPTGFKRAAEEGSRNASEAGRAVTGGRRRPPGAEQEGSRSSLEPMRT